MESRPFRAILNFAHRCAMSCEWCYVPFGSHIARKDQVASIVDRIAELGFTSITFGGGDPFQYRFIPDLLLRAKALKLFVHVDTHGKSLRENLQNFQLIESHIDLLGLPVDGSGSEWHDVMRSASGHFEIISQRLNWLKPLRSRLKLNTVISSVNVSDLPALSNLIASYGPSRWSVYQYWPLGPGAKVVDKHSISDIEFLRSAEQVRNVFSQSTTIVEINSRESRRDTYPIIHHDGEVFVHAGAPHNNFVPIGSIFDPGIMPNILAHCSPERQSAASRYDKVPLVDIGRS